MPKDYKKKWPDKGKKPWQQDFKAPLSPVLLFEEDIKAGVAAHYSVQGSYDPNNPGEWAKIVSKRVEATCATILHRKFATLGAMIATAVQDLKEPYKENTLSGDWLCPSCGRCTLNEEVKHTGIEHYEDCMWIEREKVRIQLREMFKDAAADGDEFEHWNDQNEPETAAGIFKPTGALIDGSEFDEQL